MMTGSPPLLRGMDPNLPTCGEALCGGHGTCVLSRGGGADTVCDCDLGYKGPSCDDTVNGNLSVPLTLSVLGVIFGLLLLAFIAAKLRQKQKRMSKKKLAAQHGSTIPVCEEIV